MTAANMDDTDSRRTDAEVLECIASLVDSLPHLVGITDADGRVLWVNRAGRRFLGVDADQALTTAEVFTESAFERYRTDIQPELQAGRTWAGTLAVHRGDGAIATVDAVVVGRTGAGDALDWVAILAVDVTEQREREAELAHRASHDPLTGLPNRALALDRLHVATAVAERTNTPLAVIALDLDGFKEINDEHGHAAGDLVLQQVTARLVAAVRSADTVARFGGDEFLVVVHPPESVQAALRVAERIRHQVASPGYVIGEETVHLTASIGLAVADPSRAQGAVEQIEAADRGMYRAKRAGGNCVRVSGTADEPDHLSTAGDELSSALRAGQIRGVFDPVVEIDTGRVLSLQVGARWDHPSRGTLPPSAFHDDAEVTGQLGPVWWAAAEWAVRAAADSAVTAPLDIPLSAPLLADPDVAERIRNLRDEAPQVTLRMVVAERSLSELPGAGLRTIEDLERQGIGIVLAEHGKGGLPLAVLAGLPLAAVMVDASITRAARAHPNAVALATHLARNHQVPCIAVDVDDPSDLDVLAVLGVKAVRGPVTGGPWNADRLASQKVTPPRP